MGKAVGIDLGTTNSAVSVVMEDGRPRIVHNSEGQNITPSVVLFRDNEVIVGRRAKSVAVAQEQNVAIFAKRHMCEESWEFTDGRGKSHRPEEISALILKKLVEDAQKALGQEINEAVITVPAYFADMERNRTRTAGELAGLKVLRLINEPTAAAIAYGLESMGQDKLVMVYDLGGGTFDVTIIKIEEQEIKVVTSAGDKFLGGVDFDNLLAEYFAQKFKIKFDVDPLEEPRTYQDFLLKAEQAKHDLSADTITYVSLSAAGENLDIEIKRDEFENLIRPRVQNTIDLAQTTLKDASKKLEKEISWNDINTILLVGGSTRIPLVQHMVEELTGKKAEVGINPDEVVAIGAAIVAAQETGKQVVDKTLQALPSFDFKDVTAHALGVLAIDESGKECNSIIIPKDSEIPVEESHLYTTVVDNQTDVHINVLQGEDKNPEYCDILGEGILSGIPPMPKGVPQIKCTMSYDKEGIVHLTAEELSSGKKLDIEIKNPSLLTKEQKKEIANEIAKVTVK